MKVDSFPLMLEVRQLVEEEFVIMLTSYVGVVRNSLQKRTQRVEKPAGTVKIELKIMISVKIFS